MGLGCIGRSEPGKSKHQAISLIKLKKKEVIQIPEYIQLDQNNLFREENLEFANEENPHNFNVKSLYLD